MIPLTKPWIAGTELDYLAQVIAGGEVGSDGRFTRACAGFLAERVGVGQVLMTPSGTAALELAALLCDLGPGDEVLLPSFTFTSTANAVLRTGARPVLIDVRPDTLNLDEELIATAIGERTKAVIPVHYAVACAMDAIRGVAAAHGLRVIEDAALGLGGRYRGQPLGSLGDLAAFSFHYTKTCVGGEGGALCVNAPELRERAEVVREKGTNRSRFLRGEVDRYTWVDVGSSFVPSELACAFLYAQLEALDRMAARRQELAAGYRHLLAPLAAAGFLELPALPSECQPAHALFYVLLPSREIRDALMAQLRAAGIQASFHYQPLHSSPMGRRLGYRPEDLPVAEDRAGRLLRLPFYTEQTAAEQARVVEAIDAFARVAWR